LIGNPGTLPLYVNETGSVANMGSPSWIIQPGGVWPPYPLTAAPSGAVSIVGGTTGQVYTAREW
jgi:hypothetical protein